MKKIVSIHLNNKVFQMEEDAYLYLQQTLSRQWKKDELEVQIADRVEEKLVGGKTVVSYPDVVDVLYQLGFPNFEPSGASSKKLYRQPVNKMIAGVCTGLGEYFDVDPVALRILFVLAFFLGLIGVWIYVALWIIVPQASRTIKA
jgi:phage shock protein PspC (stress-responsive transcriptional regulator)